MYHLRREIAHNLLPVVYSKSGIDPRTDHCGTPQVKSTDVEYWSLTCT